MQKRKPFEGRKEGEVFAEFMENPYWKSTKSEDGWWRILNWMTGLTLVIYYNEAGIVTGHHWSK